MKQTIKPEYWFCLIGPTDRNTLIDGADFPMRMAVRDKFANVTGEPDSVCASGWGVSEKKYEALRKVFSTPDDSLDELFKTKKK